MDDCLFCKIVKGDIPSSKIYEDADVLGILDIGPVNKGHALLMPKKHSETIMDTPDEVLIKMAPALKKLTKAVKEGVDADGVNILQNNLKPSGQLIPHVHFHVIPRFEGDGFRHWPQGKYEEGEMEEYMDKIGKLLK